MNKTRTFTAALLALGFTAFTANAQYDDAPTPQKDENIIIHKKGSSDEKLTIVVDGDKVTVNGKPLADFKDGNVEIITNGETPVPPPLPGMNIDEMPMPPGGLQMLSENSASANRAFLGVMSERADNGVKIKDVTKGSPAEKAGLQKGDIITKVGDAAIQNPDDLYETIGTYNAGDSVSISYNRNGEAKTTSATLDKNKQKGFTMNRDNFRMIAPHTRNFSYNWNNSNKPHLGIEVQDTEDGNGVKITDVNDDDAPAAKAGLKEDDIITSINGNSVKSVDDLKAIFHDAKAGDSFTIQYLHDGKTQTTQVKFPKDLKSADL